MINRNRDADQHHGALRLFGGEAVRHGEGFLFLDGVIPLGLHGGFKFHAAQIDYAAQREILLKGNIGADAVCGARARGRTAALGERNRGFACVVVLDILEIRRRLHNGQYLRVVIGIVLALELCDNAVIVNIRRCQRDLSRTPSVKAPAAAAQTQAGTFITVVHRACAEARALIFAGALADVVIRRLVVVAADVDRAAIAGRQNKQNLLTSCGVAVKVADDWLKNNRAVLQNEVNAIGLIASCFRALQCAVLVLENLTANDDIRHRAAAVKAHDSQ